MHNNLKLVNVTSTITRVGYRILKFHPTWLKHAIDIITATANSTRWKVVTQRQRGTKEEVWCNRPSTRLELLTLIHTVEARYLDRDL